MPLNFVKGSLSCPDQKNMYLFVLKTGRKVMNEFMNEIQSRNLFEKIGLTNTGCMGPCMLGPSVLVYPEGVMYGKLKKEDVKTIIEQHLLGGEPVSSLMVPAEVW
ncbi:MAG: (2Fe-2S) ferredoxin domain-containing protein [Methylococcaceae bacterium]|nr:(2Fe-2S) ferredoxin domain-containing protein [Methylococcaceae bacterium]